MYSPNYLTLLLLLELFPHRILPSKGKTEINQLYIIRLLVEKEEVFRLKVTMCNLQKM